MRLNSSQNDAKLRLDGFCESLKGEGKKLLLDTNPTTNSLIVFVLKKTEGNFRWQTSHRHLHSVERQSEGVQLVEGIGLVSLKIIT